MNELPWTKPPQYLGDFPEKQWLCGAYENPVAISLSTYLMEDFGVSLAQAQQAGWPCIVSDWGGHADIKGRNIIRVPSQFLFLANSHDVYKRGLVYSVAEFITESLTNPSPVVNAIAHRNPSVKHSNPIPVLGRLNLIN